MGSFFMGIWNFLVSITPTVVHTLCQLADGASNAINLGGSPGSSPNWLVPYSGVACKRSWPTWPRRRSVGHSIRGA